MITLPHLVAGGTAATISTAEAIGILDALGAAHTADSLAAKLDLHPHATRLVLHALEALGFVTCEGGRYLRLDTPLTRHHPWSGLERFLRTGDVSPHIDAPSLRGESYARTVLALAEPFAPAARQLADHLEPVARILDVGTGSGVWSLAMAARARECRVTGVDLPEVVPSFLALATTYGVADRVDTLAGDYFYATPAAPADRVVLANVLHLQTEAEAAELLRRWAEQVGDGGELVVVDIFGGETPERRITHAIYAINLGMRTARGAPHPLTKLRQWCADAGFPDQRVIALDRGGAGLSALVCRRQPTTRSLPPPEVTTIATAELEALRDELARGRRRQQYIFGGCTDALMGVRYAEGRIHTQNQAFRALFGVEWSDFEIHEYADVLAAEEVERFAELVRRLERGDVGRGRHLFRMVRGDGTPFRAEVTCFEPTYASSAIFAIRDHDEMARHARLETLGALVAGVVHDLNTPLGSLNANADVVGRLAARIRADATDGGADSARLTRDLATLDATAVTIQSAVERIAGMLRSLGEFADLEGRDLNELAAHFGSGMARAVCERIKGDDSAHGLPD